jgi:hypothetical protein
MNTARSRFEAVVESLSDAVAVARDQWQYVAVEFNAARKLDNWDEVKPAFELILYLTNLDYEIKVLVQRIHVDFANRGVWEKYLGLALYEGISAVPKLTGRVLTHLTKTVGRDSEQVASIRAAAKAFNAAVLHIKTDKEFWDLLEHLRNETSAHHTGKGDNLMETHALWALTAGLTTVTDVPSSQSKISHRSTELALAARQLVNDIESFAKRKQESSS